MVIRNIKGEAIDKAAKALDRLPELPRKERRFSTREAVETLTTQIYALKERGYSLEHISAELKKCSIDISPASLRRYLRKPRLPEPDSGAQPPPAETR